jgi:hypothetical protein
MAALETGIKPKAQLVLLHEPTSKWGIRHPGYQMIWPQEGGYTPRMRVGVRTDGRLRLEYRSDLGQHSMGDVMGLDVSTETGRKIRVVSVYDQKEKGRNTATRSARMAHWNNIMTDETIVCRDFNSHSQRWDPNCRRERDATFWKDWSENFLMQLGNDGQCTREGSNGSKSVIDLTWLSPLESLLGLWRLVNDHDVTGSDHREIIWETKRDPTMYTLPSKVGERIRWDRTLMRKDDNDEADLLWLMASETRPTLDDFSFCEDIESETLWIEETLTNILNQKGRRIRLYARSKRW